jgi:hypothetical protein
MTKQKPLLPEGQRTRLYRLKDRTLDVIDIAVGVATPIGAIILVVLSRAGIVAEGTIPRWIVPILAAMAISGLMDRYRRFSRIDKHMQSLRDQLSELGVLTRGIDFHLSRAEAPKFRDLAERANSDVLIVMLAPAYLTFYERDCMRRLAERGITLRFLLPSPSPGDAPDPMLQRIGRLCDDSDYHNVLRDFLRNILIWRSEQTDDVRRRIEIRTYDTTLPSLNVLSVDRGEGDSPLWVELLPQGFDRMDRPSISIDRSFQARQLHDLLIDKYELLWKQSQVYEQTGTPDVP